MPKRPTVLDENGSPASLAPILGVSFGIGDNDFTTTKFCKFENEQIYLWQSTMKRYRGQVWFVSKLVNPPSASSPWKTFAACLKIAQAFSTLFDVFYDLQYDWEPNFAFDREYTQKSYLSYSSTLITDLETVQSWYPVLALLAKDEAFFRSSLLLLNSFELHYSCMSCELTTREPAGQMHNHPEPATWLQAQHLVYYEPAVVQAMRAIESIVGEPVDLRDSRKRERFGRKWESVGIDFGTDFSRARTPFIETFVEYYGKFRNPSSHGYLLGSKRLTRTEVIDVQALALTFLNSYISKNTSVKEAKVSLKPNDKAIKTLVGSKNNGYISKNRRRSD